MRQKRDTSIGRESEGVFQKRKAAYCLIPRQAGGTRDTAQNVPVLVLKPPLGRDFTMPIDILQ